MTTPLRPRRSPWRLGAMRVALCLGLAFAFLAPWVLAEEGDEKPQPRPELGTRVGPGVGREQMWPAPTAEDWAKPVLLTFQRTWKDALAVAKETGKPILVCINMDGEIASEHYAGVRYREPEIAKIYEPYVCVIASVYRHNPRDHDDQGRRILCPRFGSVTCGEHIGIEPTIFEKFCDGRRIAPRHIAVDLEGKEAYDVFYVNDTAGVFDAIQDGIQKFPPAKPTVVRGDRPIVERVASRDVRDRTAVEEAYRDGDATTRKQLLEAARKHPEAAPLDLLRQAIFGLDVDQSRTARDALATVNDPSATPLISEAMQVPMAPAERDALIAALKRLGGESALARWLAGVHQGLQVSSTRIDPSAWKDAGGGTFDAPATADADTLTLRVEGQAKAADERPDDPAPRLEYAETALALAQQAPRTYLSRPRLGRQIARHLYADAKRAALEAEALGDSGWRVNTVLALASYYGGDKETAYTRAGAAMDAMPPGQADWKSMALVTVFAESRWTAIKKAVKANEDWPGEWLADLHAAYGVLLRHPLGTDDQVVWHYEFLVWLGAEHRASRVLTEGIQRFQASQKLHERFRRRMFRKQGAKALLAAYGKMLADHPESAVIAWYGGAATAVVGDQRRRARRFEGAITAYEQAISGFERAIEIDGTYEDVADHGIALAHAAIARVAYQLKDDERAASEIVASFKRRPLSAGTRDAMGITPGETAQMLLSRLREGEDEDAANRVADALANIDPALLVPDIGLMGD